MADTPQIAVVGAGLSGLSAALHLQAAGAHVTLIEAAPQAGGRTRTVAVHGVNVDNGQHLALGAYHDTLALLRLASLPEDTVFKRRPLALYMHAGAQQIQLCPPHWLPAPWHLLCGLLGARGLSLASKWRALVWMQHLKKQQFICEPGLTVAQLSALGNQTEQAVTWIWEPLCLAALNTPILEACAQTFLRVLQDSFMYARADSDFLVLRGDLSQVLIAPLIHYFEAQGGKLQRLNTVKAIQPSSNDCVLSTSRGVFRADGLVLAVGLHQRQSISHPFAIDIPHATYQPITTVYLQYESDFRLPQPIMGLCHGLAHWVFDRGASCDQAGLLAVVISAHPATIAKDTWVTQIQTELNAALAPYGLQCPSQPLWSKVITEKRATFSCTPYRQTPTQTGMQHAQLNPRVWLAGDDMIKDYPATIESAIRSGKQAAIGLIQALKQ